MATNRLSDLSTELVEVVEQAGQSVVQLHSRRRLPASGLVWSADGLIVTADHVLEFEEGIEVGLPDGRTAPAALVGRDPGNDLALLRAEASGLTAARWARSNDTRVGTLVLAVGRPYGNGVSASVGIVSQVTGPWRTWRGGLLDGLLMSDVAMFPGFSGGALVEAGGGLLGVCTSLLIRGVATAVPGHVVTRVAEMLSTHGRVRRGYLGLSSHPVPLPADLRQQHGLKQSAGLLVVGVEPDSPASRAGLVLGDVLLALSGQPVENADDLQTMLGPERVGTEARLAVLRGGKPLELATTVGERP